MTVELDHLFLLTDIGAPAADLLVAFGCVEGSSNTHPGQGTANRRFFFHNVMVELLWVDNPAEAQSEPIRRTRLWERWSDRQFPKWLGAIAILGSTLNIAGGIVYAYSGFSNLGMWLTMPGSILFMVWLIALGIREWQQSVSIN